jgi:hypothetical protein
VFFLQTAAVILWPVPDSISWIQILNFVSAQFVAAGVPCLPGLASPCCVRTLVLIVRLWPGLFVGLRYQAPQDSSGPTCALLVVALLMTTRC